MDDAVGLGAFDFPLPLVGVAAKIEVPQSASKAMAQRTLRDDLNNDLMDRFERLMEKTGLDACIPVLSNSKRLKMRRP
jgi:hypothetical protein